MKREEEIDLAYTDYVSTELKTDETTYIRDAFIAGAKWADDCPKGNWHNAKDELPEVGEDVLVYCRYGQLNVGYIDDSSFANGNGWMINCVNVSDDYVSYWMSLPELPEEPEELLEED
jgi:hypothetical protein